MVYVTLWPSIHLVSLWTWMFLLNSDCIFFILSFVKFSKKKLCTEDDRAAKYIVEHSGISLFDPLFTVYLCEHECLF